MELFQNSVESATYFCYNLPANRMLCRCAQHLLYSETSRADGADAARCIADFSDDGDDIGVEFEVDVEDSGADLLDAAQGGGGSGSSSSSSSSSSDDDSATGASNSGSSGGGSDDATSTGSQGAGNRSDDLPPPPPPQDSQPEDTDGPVDVNQPLFEGSRITVLQMSAALLGIKQQFKLPSNAVDCFARLVADAALPAGNHMPPSMYRLKSIIGCVMSANCARLGSELLHLCSSSAF